MKPLAVSTQIFGAHELTEGHLQAIRQSGFEAVEVFASPGHFAWDEAAAVLRIVRAMRDVGLHVCSLHAPWAPGQDIAALDGEQRQRSLRSVERAVDALLALGGNALVLHPGAAIVCPARKEEQLHLAEASIALVARYCADRGVRVALENPPPYELAGDDADMLRLYALFVAEPAVQACFDTGHAHLSPAGVTVVGQVPKDVLLVHLSDNAGHADDHLPPRAGTINWPALFAALRERRFDGYLVLELTDLPEPEQVLAAGRLWMAQAQKEMA